MRKFWIDCLGATLFVFVVLWGVDKITSFNIFNALDPVAQALEDVELTDYAFSTLRIEDPPIDTNIVIVNTSYLSRGEIGQQLRVLNQFKPKVIALDIMFGCDGGLRDSINCPQAYDTPNNLILANALSEVPTVVLAHELWQTKGLVERLGDVFIYDSIEHTDSELRGDAHEGFVNLTTDAAYQEDLKICRSFNPRIEVNGKEELAFSVKIAMLYDSVKTKRFLARGKQEEVINYRGNIVDWHGASSYPGRYIVLDWDQALDAATFTPELLKDKIVLMGFLGSDLRDTSWDDKFFTPLNKKFAGRARPDMYGVVIHANIISMILNEDYIDELAEWHKIVIAFVLCFFNMALFYLIHHRLSVWFDALSISLQLIQLIFFVVLIPYVFYWFDFKLEITAALAALALAGPCFEVYMSLLKIFLRRFRARRWITKSKQDVLTPQNTDIS